MNDKRQSASWLVLAFAGVFVVGMTILALRRYTALRTGEDLALYSQVVWNTLYGTPFYNTMLLFTEHYLGNHFTPILGAFVPFYALWEDPRTLLIAQVFASAFTAWPLYRLARERLSSPWAGILLVGALFLYPPLLYQTLADFHGIALATPLAMLAFYALLTHRDRLLIAAVTLMFLVREDVALVVMLIGIYAFVIQRRYRFGLTLAALGSVVFGALIWQIIPAFRGAGKFFYNQYYGYLGSSPATLVSTVILEPRTVMARVLHPDKLKLLLQLFVPVLGLPFLAPSVFLLGASALAYMLLVDLPFVQVYHLGSQYQALFIPFIFTGTVLAIRRLVSWFGPPSNRRWLAIVGSGAVFVISIVAHVLWGPFTDPTYMQQFAVTADTRAEWELLTRIPPDANVMADARFTGALSTRYGIYRFGGVPASYEPISYMISEATPVGHRPHPPVLLDQQRRRQWGVPRFSIVDRVGDVILRQRNGTVSATRLPQPARFGDFLALRGVTGVGSTLVADPGTTLEFATVWEGLADDGPRVIFFIHLIERRRGAAHRWAGVDRELYDGLFPSDKWASGDVVGDIFRLDVPRWMPPGEYQLHVGAYPREGQGRLTLPDGRTTADVGTVEIAPPAPLADRDDVDVPNETSESIAQGLKLRGYAPFVERLTPGQSLDITVFWRATEPMDDEYQARFFLAVEGADTPVAAWQRSLIGGRFPNTAWQPEMIIADWVRLEVPNDVPAGRYQFYVTVTGSEDPDPPVSLGSLTIDPPLP